MSKILDEFNHDLYCHTCCKKVTEHSIQKVEEEEKYIYYGECDICGNIREVKESELKQMNKYQKAVNYLYRKMENGLIEDDEQQEVYEMTIDTLEKQIPKKPIETQKLDVEWLCPACKHIVGDCVIIDNYCKNCGQKIG